MAAHVQRRDGFTMVELMIVIVIIGVIAALIAPSITEVLADYREFTCAQEIVAMARIHRDRTWASGVATMLRFREADSNGLGGISLYQGMNHKCLQTPWVQVFNAGGATLGMGGFKTLNMAYFNPGNGAPDVADVGRQVVAITAKVNNGQIPEFWLCFEPDGEAFTMTASPVNAAAFAAQTQNVTITVTRWVATAGGVKVRHGWDRVIVFPVAGLPRLR